MPTLKIMSIKPIDLQNLSGKHVILIPIRSFVDSKSRLAEVLTPEQRRSFMIECADRVIAAARDLPKVVVSSDPEVRDFTVDRGGYVLPDPGNGLSHAIQSALYQLRKLGVSHLTVAHGDLPLAKDLTTLAKAGQLTIVPDRLHEGTNVISLPTTAHFKFRYGRNSFKNHMVEAELSGLQVEIEENPSLSMDIDTPADLEELLAIDHFAFQYTQGS